MYTALFDCLIILFVTNATKNNMLRLEKKMKSITLNKQRLIECRKKLGLTKQEVSKRMQLAQPSYLRYELGERNPSIQIIQVMADVLGTSVEYLTDQTDIPTPTSYTIHTQTNPELFQLIQLYQNSDDTTRNRLITYMKKFNKKL